MATEPVFIPKEGQVDFTNVRWCPVINCIVVHNGKFLLVERSQSMRLYPAHWNGVAGFIDDASDLETKVHEEITEELGVRIEDIGEIKLCGVFLEEAPAVGKTWIVHAVKVELLKVDISLDWEATKYEWVMYPVTDGRLMLPGLPTVLDVVFNENNRVTWLK